MRYRHERTYAAAPAQVYAMLADPAFREEVARYQRALRHRVDVVQRDEGLSVDVDQVLAAHGIPSFAKKVVGDEIEIRQRETWRTERAADFEVTIPGKPGHLRGTITLSDSLSDSLSDGAPTGGQATGSQTTEAVEGEITVNIPFLGGKLERLISGLFDAALDAESVVGQRWLLGQR